VFSPLQITAERCARPSFAWPLMQKVHAATCEQLDLLVRLRAEVLTSGWSGSDDRVEWQEEIIRFMNSEIAKKLTAREIGVMEAHRQEIARRIARLVAQAAGNLYWYRD
jgi:hypothetical protein